MATGVARTKAVREYRTPNLSLQHEYVAVNSDMEFGTPMLAIHIEAASLG